MTKTNDQLNKERRLRRSQEIAKEVKDGTYQKAAFDKEASFFPVREIIKKDKDAIKKLYVDSEDDKKDA